MFSISLRLRASARRTGVIGRAILAATVLSTTALSIHFAQATPFWSEYGLDSQHSTTSTVGS